MKQVVLALLSAAVASAHAHPHHPAHAHLHNRDASPVVDMVVEPGPTVVVYVLNGQLISEADVEKGLRDGTLMMADNGAIASLPAPPAQSNYAPPPPPPPGILMDVAPTTSAEATSTSSSKWTAPPSYGPPPGPPHSPPSGGPGSSWESSSSTGVDTPFPDGHLDCSVFPSEYGAVAVDWAHLGGWIGIQQPGSNVGGYDNIKTVTHGTCSDGNCCTEGSFCSYACPAGYQKSQWPETQGATGQSVGGIQCQGGKLHLTNTALSNTLCMRGADQVTILIQNKLSKNSAVCRTDYPGTEGETIPLDTKPGTINNLTCPDGDNYYKWGNGKTSAQYYVNPQGVAVNDACQWGTASNPWGNFAPVNLGVGYTNGAAWLSIFQNLPTTSAQLDFAVEIVGDGVSGTCKYSNGQYCGGANYDQCSSTTGCTVSLSSGTAAFVFSES